MTPVSVEQKPLQQESTVPRTAPAERKTLLWLAFLGLMLRLIVVCFLYQEQMAPARNHWVFGWETGQIAGSIAAGHGFASPFHGETGPTAWLAPVYPYLLAGIFKLFGSYSVLSVFVILALNSVFSAATIFPVYDIAAELAGSGAAKLASWIWTFFPYAIYFSADRIWSHTLAAFLLAAMIAFTLKIARDNTSAAWIRLGVIAGVNAMVNPTALAVIPGILIFSFYTVPREQRGFLISRWAAMLFTLLAISVPWTVRNYIELGRIVPIRSNFWIEMRVGNTGDTSDIVPDWAHPANGTGEMEEYRQLGELRYADHKKHQVTEFVAAHPALFGWLTVRRIGYFWTGFWSLDPDFRRREPLQFPNVLLCTVVAVFAAVGLRRLWTVRRKESLFFFLVMLADPIFY
jgi:4-amino-4-deoxy-L-arabinose transferase-like glycosyltransferase